MPVSTDRLIQLSLRDSPPDEIDWVARPDQGVDSASTPITCGSERATQLELPRSRVKLSVGQNLDAFATAASVWARLHYEHAAYVENSLTIRDITFRSETEGTLSLNFDYTQQDGCSDICRDGQGHVDFQFQINNDQVTLTWSLPERPSTADEL